MSMSLERVGQVKKDVLAQMELVKLNPGWDAGSINSKVDILQIVLVEVEKVSKEIGSMSGTEKKELAVEIINSLVDIPVMPEWVEAKVIEYVIDVAISLFNKWFGKLWLEKFKK